MKLSFISPTSSLESVASQSDIHMVLAHLVLKDSKYREYYHDEKKYKVLDNGAFELGTPMSVDSILEAADAIGADEVVAPDKFHDGVATIRLVKNFLCKVKTLDPTFKNRNRTFKIMAVPHGKDFIDWFNCFEQLNSNPQVDTIGIGYKSCSVMKVIYGSSDLSLLRFYLLRTLCAAFKIKPIHLLGGGSNAIETSFYGKIPQVRSLDTSLPYVCGKFGTVFDKLGGVISRRPEGTSIDFSDVKLDSDVLKRVHHNIEIMKEWSKI